MKILTALAGIYNLSMACIKFYANGWNAATMQGIVINLGFAISFLVLSIYFSLQEKR
jgi:hypothetical protein